MNLKKCTSLFLACLLLVSNIGLAFTVHYCEGKIASVTSAFNTEEVCEMKAEPAEKPCCAKEIQAKHSKCCKDKVVNLKDKSDNSVVKTFSFQIDAPFVAQIWKPVIFRIIKVQEQAPVCEYFVEANAPPLFKLYSQYILYA